MSSHLIPFIPFPLFLLLPSRFTSLSLTWRMTVAIKSLHLVLPPELKSFKSPALRRLAGVVGPKLPWVGSELHSSAPVPRSCPIPLPGVRLAALLAHCLPSRLAQISPVGSISWSPWFSVASKVSPLHFRDGTFQTMGIYSFHNVSCMPPLCQALF